MGAPQVVLVASSPRTPPGCLTWPAWQALQAGPVLLQAGPHPQLAALRAAGVALEPVLPAPEPVLAGLLLERARTQGRATWLAGVAGDPGLVRALGELTGGGSGADLQVVYGSHDLPGARLLDVVAVLDRLRSPGGCPWDAAQTHGSLMPYLLEEAYEAYEALEEGDGPALREELGDVLLQVVLHARLATETGGLGFDVDDVAGDLVDKLVRRHPHVFAGAPVDDLEGSWAALKQAEKGRTSVTQGVPMGQPALSLARKLQSRGARLGAPVASYAGMGGELWALVERCRDAGVDPEAELRRVARRYRDRLAELEQDLPATGQQWETLWS